MLNTLGLLNNLLMHIFVRESSTDIYDNWIKNYMDEFMADVFRKISSYILKTANINDSAFFLSLIDLLIYIFKIIPTECVIKRNFGNYVLKALEDQNQQVNSKYFEVKLE